MNEPSPSAATKPIFVRSRLPRSDQHLTRARRDRSDLALSECWDFRLWRPNLRLL